VRQTLSRLVLHENGYEVAWRAGQFRVRHPYPVLGHLDADVRKPLSSSTSPATTTAHGGLTAALTATRTDTTRRRRTPEGQTAM